MANEITERSCLEAELLLGYKLFSKQSSIQSQKAKAKNESGAVKLYEMARSQTLYQPSNLPSVYTKYLAFCDEEKRKIQDQENKKKEEEINKIKSYREKEFAKSKKNLIILLIDFLVILTAGIVLTILAANGKIFGDWSFMFVPLFFLVILPTLICVPLGISRFLGMKNLKAELEKPILTAHQSRFYQPIDFAVYAKRYYSEAALIEEYDRLHTNDLAQKQATAETAKKQLEACNQTLQKIENVYNNVVKSLTEVPVFYFKQDAIEKMLFFYVNKRADNIRDLINLYETTVFQEAVLNSLKDIAISVDRLTATVRGSFQQLGLQLGVLNESIMENTRVQRISQEKLSEIKNENERHYLEMVDAIEEIELISNTYVTVK